MKRSYEACDRHGVMVWQDFWLANPWDGPDPDDNELFLSNVKDFGAAHSQSSVDRHLLRTERRLSAANRWKMEFARFWADLHPGLHYISKFRRRGR